MRFETIPANEIKKRAERSGIPKTYTFNVVMTQLDLMEEILMSSPDENQSERSYTFAFSDEGNTIKITGTNDRGRTVNISEHEFLTN